jgi:threonine/homoserine/homoserine lactone efflux protein
MKQFVMEPRMYWTEFLTVALIHLLAVASRAGFAVVVRALTHGRRAGTCLPHWAWVRRFSCMWAIRCWVSGSLSQSIVLFNALKWAAAAYLLYIGFKALRAQACRPGGCYSGVASG